MAEPRLSQGSIMGFVYSRSKVDVGSNEAQRWPAGRSISVLVGSVAGFGVTRYIYWSS